jgi:hypothetical protein
MELLDNVKQQASAQLDSQKGRATDGLSAIAHAVRGTTDELRREQHDVIAQYVERMAEQLEQFSTQLRNKDITALLADARQLARRQPAIFIGGSFAAGLLAARFLKSSRRADDERWARGEDGDRGDYPRVRGYGEAGGAERTTFGAPRATGTPRLEGVDTPGGTRTPGSGTGSGATGRL